jgi:hypothetical protein
MDDEQLAKQEGSQSVYDYSGRRIRKAGYAAFVYGVLFVATSIFGEPAAWIWLTALRDWYRYWLTGIRHLQEKQNRCSVDDRAGYRQSAFQVGSGALFRRNSAIFDCYRIFASRRKAYL